MDCTEVVLPDCPVEYTIYGYYPSFPANTFLAVWFGVFFFPNVVFGIYYKAWTYMIALAVGCAIEAIGYAGRLLLHDNPFSWKGFQIQICCLILGPAFNSAAIYLTLKHIVLTFGPEYGVVKPRFYTYIFIGGDVISLILQAIGGGMAATAGDDQKKQDLGTDIMIAGIVWQVITLLVFGICAGWYVVKRHRAAKQGHRLSEQARRTIKDLKFRLFAVGVVTAFLAVFLRCVYRIAEMAQGWANEIQRDEISYMVFEGAMIAYATMVQTVFHPGYCFPQLTGRGRERSSAEEKDRNRTRS